MAGEKQEEPQQRLVSEMRRTDFLFSERVERAFLRVPRLPFIREYVGSADEAYRDRVVPLRSGVSTASQPSIMAMMLEALEVEPGHRVLEVGTASGYGAALLADLAGKEGKVTTVELEEDLARKAAEKLRDQGYGRVRVLAADGGAFLLPPGSVDRIIATAGAADLPEAWFWELALGGVLVAPLQLGPTALLLKVRCLGPEGHWLGGFLDVPVSFVPFRRKEDPEQGGLVQLASRDDDLVEETLEEGRPWLRSEADYAGLAAWALAEPLLPGPEETLRDWVASGRPRASSCRIRVYSMENKLKMSVTKRICSGNTEQLQHDFA